MVIVDFGTATTFDVVNDEGSYCGGAIAPGINLSLEALHLAAAKLPRIAVEPPESVIGTSTISAMQSGVFWGYVGLIEGLGRPHPGGIRQTDDGDRHRRFGTAVRQALPGACSISTAT